MICFQLNPSYGAGPILNCNQTLSNIFSLPKLVVRIGPNERFWTLNSIHYEERMPSASFAGTHAACHGSPRAGEVLQRQGIPASPQRYSYSAAFLLFRPQFTHFLAHYSSLEREAAGLYVHFPRCCVYRSGLWLATTLPCLPSSAGGELQAVIGGSPSFVVCSVYSSHSALLCFSIK